MATSVYLVGKLRQRNGRIPGSLIDDVTLLKILKLPVLGLLGIRAKAPYESREDPAVSCQ